MSTEPIWTSIEAVRAAILDGSALAWANQRTLRPEKASHLATVLALTPEELTRLIPPTAARERSAFRIVSCLASWAWDLARKGRFEEALRLYDAATPVPWHEDASLYCNALWAVQDDNHHLGVMRERARRYLERAAPHGPRNPAIYFNSACVCLELADFEGAIAAVRDAVRFGFERLEAIRDEPFLAPLRADPRFLAAFLDPALLAQRRENAMPPALRDLRATQGHWDEIDFEVFDAFEPPEQTRAWLGAWAGNDRAAFADDLRVFGQDSLGGRVAFLRTDRARALEGEPIVGFLPDGEVRVVACGLLDFLVLFAANVGPMETAPKAALRPLLQVQAVLAKHFAGASARTVEQALADAAAAAPRLLGPIRAARS